MARSVTSRGFTTYADFLDANGLRVTLRESSADPLDKVWLFLQVPLLDKPMAGLLDVDAAICLRDALNEFVVDQRSKSLPKPWWPELLKRFRKER